LSADARLLALVSGFRAFESFSVNPSGVVAQRLADSPPAGWHVECALLPVSFARAPEEWERRAARASRPALYLALGVSRERGFRLELRAGPRLKLVDRPDVDGRVAAEFHREGPALATSIDLARLRSALRARGVADARLSRNAGGYVCEHLYHRLLQRSAASGIPGLFVHVPPERFAPLERQVEVVGWILAELQTPGGARTSPRP
jgi:pyroglutamyl-peptidase